jgi:HSP20 family molecular chaperone IbpA
MLGEALSMLDRAQRLQRQFFTHDVVSWEPPVDIVEADNALLVHVALPGVSADAITVALDPAGITVSALRAFPCRTEGGQIHRLEIPYGRFERHIGLPLGDPYTPIELAGKRLENGVLTLTFRRKEGA